MQIENRKGQAMYYKRCCKVAAKVNYIGYVKQDKQKRGAEIIDTTNGRVIDCNDVQEKYTVAAIQNGM